MGHTRESLSAHFTALSRQLQSSDQPRLVVLRRLEVLASPPADEDASYKWVASQIASSSLGSQASIGQLLLDFLDVAAELPCIAILGLLCQGYQLPSSFLRPPRFSHSFVLPSPTSASRLEILRKFIGTDCIDSADLAYLAEVCVASFLTSNNAMTLVFTLLSLFFIPLGHSGLRTP